MSKIINDKYYTPSELAQYCINKTYEVIGKNNIYEVIEPSAGNGSFSSKIQSCIAYDVDPETHGIIQQDFLKLDIPYKKGRLIIGNPPYGARMNLAQKFYKHSMHISDYIAFILPISQLHNKSSLFEFDLIHSEDLGKHKYSEVSLHCCFNIYKRPSNNQFNTQPKNKLKDITIVRQDSKKYNQIINFDLRICYWGDGCAGKILNEGQNYSAEYKIIINNHLLKENIIHVLSNINWKEELNCIAMLKIQQFHIVNILKKYIPEIN